MTDRRGQGVSILRLGLPLAVGLPLWIWLSPGEDPAPEGLAGGQDQVSPDEAVSRQIEGPALVREVVEQKPEPKKIPDIGDLDWERKEPLFDPMETTIPWPQDYVHPPPIPKVDDAQMKEKYKGYSVEQLKETLAQIKEASEALTGERLAAIRERGGDMQIDLPWLLDKDGNHLYDGNGEPRPIYPGTPGDFGNRPLSDRSFDRMPGGKVRMTLSYLDPREHEDAYLAHSEWSWVHGAILRKDPSYNMLEEIELPKILAKQREAKKELERRKREREAQGGN